MVAQAGGVQAVDPAGSGVRLDKPGLHLGKSCLHLGER